VIDATQEAARENLQIERNPRKGLRPEGLSYRGGERREKKGERVWVRR
jgi:hypothetical protein